MLSCDAQHTVIVYVILDGIVDAIVDRGVYFGKSDCLVLPQNKSFY